MRKNKYKLLNLTTMKRFYFIAAMAIMAAGCQKTEIQNEVQTPIGFSTEVGKQTRAIVQDGTYLTDQPFGVYAYGYQLETVEVQGVPVTQRIANSTSTPMNNIEISYDDNGTDADASDDAWRATGDVKYYWPNDPRTRLDFYAYSPAQVTDGTATEAHQKLTGVITHSEKENENDTQYGLVLSNYVHSNMYVDFMVATPVIGATYSTVNQEANKAGTVPLDFKHKMTQVNFTVKIADNADYPNVDFTINSIVLNNIKSNGTYTYTSDKWTDADTPATSSYQIYPATTAGATSATDYSAGAPALTNVDAEDERTEQTVILRTDPTGTRGGQQLTVNAANPGKSFSTTPVTMIPQTLTNTDAQNDVDQSFTISYTISGTGVAKETIVKTFDFADAVATEVPAWDNNKKITYTLTISLNEITFAPSVTNWSEDDAAGSFDDDSSNV